jgi:hypothetical protein
MTYTYRVSTININNGFTKYDDFESAKKYAENLSKEKRVSLISIFNASWMSDERLSDIYFIDGKQIEQSMTWAKFKSIAREFYK